MNDFNADRHETPPAAPLWPASTTNSSNTSPSFPDAPPVAPPAPRSAPSGPPASGSRNGAVPPPPPLASLGGSPTFGDTTTEMSPGNLTAQGDAAVFPPVPPTATEGQAARFDSSLSAGATATMSPPAPPISTFEIPPSVTTPPPTVASSGDTPSSSGGRRWILALLAAAALVVGGFVVGNLLGDDTQTQVASTAPVANDAQVPVESAPEEPQVESPAEEQAAIVEEEPVAVAPAAPASPAQPIPVPETAPLQGDAIEPVSEVAKAVGPAVVLIETSFGQGSGIIYDESGLIVTNAHVVEDATQVRVRLASGFLVEGEVLGADSRRDVAVVKITTDAEFGVAVLAPTSTVEVGQLAVAIGSPFGLEQTVTAGIVSATGRTFQGQDSPVEMIQTDAPINPGNSGGALADRQGRVVGMNTAIRTNGSNDNAGVGFAIPADTFKLISDRLVNGESLESAYLGVRLADVLVGEPGALIQTVEPGTAAENFGIEVGDLIVGFNAEQILSGADLAAAIQITPPNSPVTIEVVRNGERLTLDVVLGALGN